MSSKYTVRDQTCTHFLTYATVGWADVFTRTAYRNIILESLNYCATSKRLQVYAWCLMTNHVHLGIGTEAKPIETIMRDHKHHTAEAIHKALLQEAESRREWMLPLFRQAGTANSHNRGFQLVQQDYHPIELDTRDKLIGRLHYTYDNPVRAGFVAAPEHWAYSSAMAYQVGILYCNVFKCWIYNSGFVAHRHEHATAQSQGCMLAPVGTSKMWLYSFKG